LAYLDIDDARKVLKENIFQYPADIDAEIEFAQTVINSKLAGFFTLPFDDVVTYATVPLEIKWIGALLTSYKLWDGVVALEGQADDTAAKRWHKEAMEWLECLREGRCSLTLVDGTIVVPPDTAGGPRSYPDGVRTKADSADNDPLFTRAQVGSW